MKTAFVLIVLAFFEYLEPTLPTWVTDTEEDCEALGTAHVQDLIKMVREKDGGSIGSVWFYCQEVRGMRL